MIYWGRKVKGEKYTIIPDTVMAVLLIMGTKWDGYTEKKK